MMSVLPGDLVVFEPVVYRAWNPAVVLRHVPYKDGRGITVDGYYEVLTREGVKLVYEGFMKVLWRL